MLIALYLQLCLKVSMLLFRPSPEPVDTSALVQNDSLQQVLSSGYEFADLAAKRQQGESPFLKFLDQPTIRMFVYHLPRNGVDGQTPHRYDEVYYVVNGKAELTAGKDTYSVKAGSIVFVKKEVEHKFHDITEDLDVIVFFSIQPS